MTEQNDFMENDPATEKAQRIAELIAGYIRQSLTPAEHDELDNWVGESDVNMRLFEELTDENKLKEGVDFLENVRTQEALQHTKAILEFAKPYRRFSLAQYAAAATLLLFIGLSAYFILHNSSPKENHIAQIASEHPVDLQPGKDKAVLTLADGRTIILDEAQNGALATQGNTAIVKDNGQLRYDSRAGAPGLENLSNTVSTPRGGNYTLTLSDGTRIWLNAASTITYPAVFTGKERKIVITGEAYFEVAKNKSMPFVVDIKDRHTGVEVLGTHFNVNSYKDEPSVKTTLLEGSVKVVNQAVSGSKTVFLKPGQQAQVTDGQVKVDPNADVEAAMAWKNGMFRFSNTDLRTIMKEVSRWYDVDVVFETATNPSYTSLLSRNLPASKLFAVLEENGGVHFKVEGKTVKVLP